MKGVVTDMNKIEWSGSALLAPVPPALVTCSSETEDGEVINNILTVAWTGIVCSKPAKTYISLRPSRYSYELVKKSGEFVINLTTEKLAKAADFCGVRSGRSLDKFAACGLHIGTASKVRAPILTESPVSLECRVSDVMELGSHVMFLADIVAVDVDENIVDSEGRLMIERAGLIAYTHGDYFALGRRLGDFGFSVRKKRKNTYGKRPPKSSVKQK